MVQIHPTATVEDFSVIEDGTKIWHYAHVREFAYIGKNCVIGKDVYVDQHVKIGDGCKIENGVSIYNGVELEDLVFVGPNTTFTNDPYPRAFNTEWKVVRTVVHRGVGIGAGSVIICGIEIGEFALIGAGSIVTLDVPAYALYMGQPARFVSWVCRCGREKTSVQGELCTKCSASIVI